MSVSVWLEPPSYGYVRNETLYVPSARELWAEFFSRLNVFRDRRNWLATWSALVFLFFLFCFVQAMRDHHSWWQLGAALFYAFFVLNIHTTTFVHRFAAHGAFQVQNKALLFFLQNLTIKIIPEEIFVISHVVHHQMADLPGDPHNAKAGRLYCFLADFNHQLVNRSLSEPEYCKMAGLMAHLCVWRNDYRGYQKWGSISHPLSVLGAFVGNWLFWFFVLSCTFGQDFAYLIFAMAFLWLMSIRNFNFKAHGGGVDKRRPDFDLSTEDLSINKALPGFTAGEWHSHHHLFPRSARCDFTRGQVDFSWLLICGLERLGLVRDVIDCKKDFLKKYGSFNPRASQ